MKGRVIRRPELIERVGLSDVTLWRLERMGRFPKRVQLGGQAVGWLEVEIDAWLDERAAEREQRPAFNRRPLFVKK